MQDEMQDEDELRQMSEAIALSMQSDQHMVDDGEADNGEGVEAVAGPFGVAAMLARSPRRLLAEREAGASRERDEEAGGGPSSWLFSPPSALNASGLSAETNASPGARSGLLEQLHQRHVAQRVGPDDLDSIAGVAARRHHSSSSEVRSSPPTPPPPAPPPR